MFKSVVGAQQVIKTMMGMMTTTMKHLWAQMWSAQQLLSHR